MSFSSPDSFKPRSSRNIAFSSSSSSAISCSIWAHTTNTSASQPFAYSLTFCTKGFSAPSSARSSSETLAAKITGLSVRRLHSLNNACSSSSSVTNVLASCPSSRCAFTFFKNSTSAAIFLSLWAARADLEIRRSNTSISEKINSKLIVSISRRGSTLPSTWITLLSSKQRTTWTIASTSRIFARNWFPRPSPLEAPFTSPAISTNSIVAGTIFAESYISDSTLRRWSGTATIPIFGSIVQNG